MRSKFLMFFLLLSLACLKTASAGPPFLNDDPEPVEFKHWEAYLFSTHDAKRSGIDALGPAVEFNVGAAPNLQLHLILPLAYSLPDSGPRTFGLGISKWDLNFGSFRKAKKAAGGLKLASFLCWKSLRETPTVAWAMAGYGRSCPCSFKRVGSRGQLMGDSAMPLIRRKGNAIIFMVAGSSNGR